MADAERRLRRSLENLLKSKQDKPQLYPGLMGAYVDGVPSVKVSNRADFVWVRLRGVQSEPIQAFNDKVGEHFNLPILVYREPENPHLWRIYGRDVSKYQDWGGASYLPPHGKTHSMSAEQGAGSDIVWVQKPQIMPMLPHPVNSGSMSIYIEPEAYFWNGEYHYFAGTGTQSFEPFKPTGAVTSKFVTVYIRGEDGTIQYLEGTEYPATFPPNDIWGTIAVPDPDEGFPIGAVNLFTGTTRIGWREIYDLRYLPGPINGTGTNIGIYDEGSPLGQASDFDFVGVGVTAEISGSRAVISVQGNAQVADEGVILGVAEVLDFTGLGVNVTLSGAYASIAISGGGGGGGTGSVSTYMLAGLATPLVNETGTGWQVPVYPYATGSLSVFINGVNQRPGIDFTESSPSAGEYTLADNPPSGAYHVAIWGIPTVGGGGGDGAFGVFGLDDGIPLGTGSWLEAGDGLAMSRSGTVLRMDAEPPITGSIVLFDEGGPLGSIIALNFVGAYVAATISGSYGRVAVLPPGTDQIGIYGLDDGAAQGTGTQLNVQYGLQLTRSGTRILLRVEPPVTGSVVVAEEGVPQGSVTVVDFVGDAVTVTISGSRAEVAVSAAPNLPLTGTVVVYDEDTILGSFDEIRFKGAGVAAYNSGTYAAVNIEGGGGPGGGGEIGVFGLDDGVPLGTGAWLEAGDGLSMSRSGTVLRMDAGGALVSVANNDVPTGSFDTLNVKHGSYLGMSMTGTVATINLSEDMLAYRPNLHWATASNLTGAPSFASINLTANRMYMMPFVVARPTRIDQMGYYSTSYGTGTVIVMGFYKAGSAEDDNYASPYELAGYTISVPTGAGGAKTQAMVTGTGWDGTAIRLQPGLYWMFIVSNAPATTTLQNLTNQYYLPFLGWDGSTALRIGTYKTMLSTPNAPPPDNLSGTFSGYIGPGGVNVPVWYSRIYDYE